MKLSTNLSITKTTFNSIHKTSIKRCFFLLLFGCITTLSIGQNKQHEMYAFTVSKRGYDDVILYKSDTKVKNWEVVGSTGRSSIRSLAADSENGIIYAVDKGQLGSLNSSTAKFSPIGEIGSGSGEVGTVKIDSIYGLTYDSNRDILYATHRMKSWDLILQINPKTGKIISNSMTNAEGKKADYKTIKFKTFYLGQNYESKDLLDLAYDSKQKVMFIVDTYFYEVSGLNSYLSIDEQNPNRDFIQSPIKKLTGIAFDHDSNFYGSFLNNKISGPNGFSGAGAIFDSGELTTIYPGLDRFNYFYGLVFSTLQQQPQPQPCSSYLTITSSPISGSTQKALYTISSNALINADAMFIAGESVNLNNNFAVVKSANFEINIDADACR